MTQIFPFQERRRNQWWGWRRRESLGVDPGVRGKPKRKGSWTPAHEGWLRWCQFEETSRTWSLELISEEVSGIIDFICSSPAWLIHVSGHTYTHTHTHTHTLINEARMPYTRNRSQSSGNTFQDISCPCPHPSITHNPPLLFLPFLTFSYSFFSFACFLPISYCSLLSSYSSPKA